MKKSIVIAAIAILLVGGVTSAMGYWFQAKRNGVSNVRNHFMIQVLDGDDLRWTPYDSSGTAFNQTSNGAARTKSDHIWGGGSPHEVGGSWVNTRSDTTLALSSTIVHRYNYWYDNTGSGLSAYKTTFDIMADTPDSLAYDFRSDDTGTTAWLYLVQGTTNTAAGNKAVVSSITVPTAGQNEKGATALASSYFMAGPAVLFLEINTPASSDVEFYLGNLKLIWRETSE